MIGNIHVRRILFRCCTSKAYRNSDALLGYLKEKKIFGKCLDEKAIFSILSSMIKENKVDQTPTCVIQYSQWMVKNMSARKKLDWIDGVKDAFGNGEKVMSHVLVLGG